MQERQEVPVSASCFQLGYLEKNPRQIPLTASVSLVHEGAGGGRKEELPFGSLLPRTFHNNGYQNYYIYKPFFMCARHCSVRCLY